LIYAVGDNESLNVSLKVRVQSHNPCGVVKAGRARSGERQIFASGSNFFAPRLVRPYGSRAIDPEIIAGYNGIECYGNDLHPTRE
jgi:hypothetical protein